jgi:hypothetical protein
MLSCIVDRVGYLRWQSEGQQLRQLQLLWAGGKGAFGTGHLKG